MAELRSGVRLALDWGKARIGVAACDRDGLLAFPVATLDARDPWRALSSLIEEYEPFEIIIGLPVTLAGEVSFAADYVLAAAGELAARTTLPVRLQDERLSTGAASRRLVQAGKSAKKQRALIDRAAAVEILQQALDAERAGKLGDLVMKKETT